MTSESVCGTDLINTATVFTKTTQGGHSWEKGLFDSATVAVAPGDPELSIKKTLKKPFNGTVEPGDTITFEPGQSETRMWTITATEEEIESRIINVEMLVDGKTPSGTSTLMASMATLQAGDDEVEN